ncbi:MAG: Cj0069 family protein [Betaproteobacteria bacterium]|nr:Cj0069 family protein [Betaproteobacteria bacterium]
MNAPAGAAVPRPAPRLAILYPGDRAAHDRADPAASRFAALFAAFAAAGMHAEPAIYHDDFADEVGAQLHGVHGVLVWHNPIEGGRTRARLDALLRDVAGGGASGVFVSTHPDVILRLGTKDVLLAARALPFGSDVHRVDSIEQLRAELPARLARGARVLKQHRGHSGIGVWRVEAIGAPGGDRFSLRHAERGSAPQVVDFEAVVQTLAPYFAGGGHMVDQAWQPRLPEGMVRAYLVGDRVAGFGHQAVNALHPGTAGGEPPPPGPRLYSGADDMRFQALRERLESEWVAQLAQATGVATADLPLLWDADFLLGERSPADIAAGRERYVLCEVNVSSVAPFPDAAIAPLVAATLRRLQAR